MTNIKRLTSRGTSLLAVIAFTVAAVAPALVSQSAYAGQFSPRKLTMSSSAPGNVSTDANGDAVAAGSGGNGAQASHTFDFTFGTSGATVGSVVLQYCTTPLLNTTCTAPTGMDASNIATAPVVTGFGGTAPALDTTTDASTTGYLTGTNACSGGGLDRDNCILLARGAASAVTGQAAIQLSFGQGGGTDWITNPTTIGTFYVRITAFSDTGYTTIVDEGAVAASIAQDIDITAKVQEKLNFSVAAATVAPTAACTALSGTGAVALGDGDGVLDIATAYDAHSYFRLNTNAAGGTNVLYSGDTLRTVGGANTIAAPAGPSASTVGTAQFGLAIDTSDTDGGNGYSFTNLAATAPYAGGAGTITNAGTAQFAFSTASVSTPVQIAGVSNSTVACDTGSVRYIGNIGTTTRAGIYRTTINYIAVPTF